MMRVQQQREYKRAPNDEDVMQIYCGRLTLYGVGELSVVFAHVG